MVSQAAERSKAQGNAAFKAQDYPLAISHYSTAIQLDPSVSTYPLNRALVHLKLDQFADAERDANTALDLDGGHNVKALFRRGLARKRLGNLARAQKDFELAIEQGAGNDVKLELDDLVKRSREEPELQARAGESTAAAAPSKTDRLRAAIANPSSSSSPSSAPPPPPTNTSTPLSRDRDEGEFGMRAVSTRKLNPSDASKPPSRGIQPQPRPASEPTTAPPASSSSSFAAKKVSRQSRQQTSSPFTLPPPSPSSLRRRPSNPSQPRALDPPSRSTVVVEQGESLTRQVSATAAVPPTMIKPRRLRRRARSSTTKIAGGGGGLTVTSLESHLVLARPGSRSRINALRSLDPSPRRLVEFVGDSLTPDLLSMILRELERYVQGTPYEDDKDDDDDDDDDGTEEQGEDEGEGEGEEGGRETSWIVELLRGLSQCRRFETSRMLLNDQEVEVVSTVLEREKDRLANVGASWSV